MIITLEDAHSIPLKGRFGYCNRVMRPWFERQELDWNDFRKNGIDSEILRATGDAMAIKLCDWVEARDGR